jgi:hypothetical protein
MKVWPNCTLDTLTAQIIVLVVGTVNKIILFAL